MRGSVIQALMLQGRPMAAVQAKLPGFYPGTEAFAVNLHQRFGGWPLSREVQAKMEDIFQTNFSDVRIHAGNEAASIGAVAFTWGSDIHFSAGQYNPHTPNGLFLLGHELTHVVQQRAGRVPNPLRTGVVVVQNKALEAEADYMGGLAARSMPGRSSSLQRRPATLAPVPVGLSMIQPMKRRSGNEGATPRYDPYGRPPQTTRSTRSNSTVTTTDHFTPVAAVMVAPAPAPIVVADPVPTTAHVAGRHGLRPVDKHGNELFTGKRSSVSWVTGFYAAYGAANAQVCARADANCSTVFQIDHRRSFYNLLNDIDKREVCDGNNHFEAYIYRFAAEAIAYPVALLPARKDNSVVRAYHNNANLQWMCDYHNPSKGGAHDPDDLHSILFTEACPGASCTL